MVSVIVPAFGTADYIAETLDSVFAQSFQDFEVLVINDDDPQSDALERAIAPWRERIRYICHPLNQGPSATRNTGILAARGDMIALVDSDDIWLPHHLETQLNYLKTYPEADLVYGNAEVFGPRANCSSFMRSSPSHGPVTLLSLLEQHCSVLTSSVVGKREAFIQSGLFDPAFSRSEDFDLWVRMVLTGYRIGYHDQIVMRYRMRTESQSSDSERMYVAAATVLSRLTGRPGLSEEQLALIRRHRDRFEAHANLTRSKIAVEAGDYEAARFSLMRANEFFHSLRLAGIIAALRVTPALIGWIYNRRRVPGMAD